MIAEFAAQIVVEAALRKPCKELALQGAEAIPARETPDRALNLSGVGFK